MRASSDISLLVVNYNGGDMLKRCLGSFRPCPPVVETVVVDNASTDGSVDGLDLVADVRVVRLPVNAGFGRANNVGLRMCRSPLVLMANPDTILDSGQLEALVEFMDEHPDVGLVGPRLLDDDGSLQLSICNYPTVLRELTEALFLHRVLPPFASGLAETVRDRTRYRTPCRADWVSGAVMLARANALADVDGFDEGFFLYAEEIDLCRRLTGAGWQVWYHPAIAVRHVGGECDANSFLALENQRSKLRYFRKHFGPARMLLFACVIAVRLAVRLPLWLGAYVLGRDERLLDRTRAAASVLLRYPRLALAFLRDPEAPAARAGGDA